MPFTLQPLQPYSAFYMVLSWAHRFYVASVQFCPARGAALMQESA